MTVIAMTREMGTLGKEVARIFARKTGYRVVHHELVGSRDDRRIRGGESEVYRFLEGTREALRHWQGNNRNRGYLTAAEVVELAMEGKVLIRGWGATRLLSAVPQVMALRVCSPMASRVQEMMRRLGVAEAVARREIQRNDAAHAGIFARFFEANWRDPLIYDLVLNTAQLAPLHCADILIDAMDSPAFAETEAGRRALQDTLLQARIAAALRSVDAVAEDADHIHVAVENSNVRLFGVVHQDETRVRAGQIAGTQRGTGILRNELVLRGSFFT